MLLHILAFVEGDMESQSLYAALAIRMVQLLDLPRKLSSDRIQRETEIRSRIKSAYLRDSTNSLSSLVDYLVNG
jgi:hypothetical protein